MIPLLAEAAMQFGPALLGGLLGRHKSKAPGIDPRLQAAMDNEHGREIRLDQTAGESRSQLEDLINGGQDAYDTSFAALMRAGMPGLKQQLQQARAGANRRGISTGDLGTTYEGNVLSAFDKNMADSAASKAIDLYNSRLGAAGSLYTSDIGRADQSHETGLDLLTGALDRKTAQENADKLARAQNTAGWLGFGGQVVGSFGKDLLDWMRKSRSPGGTIDPMQSAGSVA